MLVSTILQHIDAGHMALPEFQRGYVWNRDQVRGLMQSLYRRYPVGSLLVWATGSDGAQYRGEGQLAPGVVKLLLDGQQRMTSLYGVIRGRPPKFFDGNAKAFLGLFFHLGTEEFSFYSPIKMQDDPLWIDVSGLMREGLDPHLSMLSSLSSLPESIGTCMLRLNGVFSIQQIDLHVEEVAGPDKTVDVVVDIFNRVNSGGTKLSKGDLALAKICAEAPDARDRMKRALRRWRESGYGFDLDWLLRNVNAVTTGEARFAALHDIDADAFRQGLKRAEQAIDYLLNTIAGRLGLDHDRVFFGRYALPVMSHYLERRGGHLEDGREQDRLLFWYLQSAMWGRFSGSTETIIDRHLQAIEEMDGGLERLIGELRLWRGGLRVLPDHFRGWSRGARFYPVLYLLTRVGEARDWGNGLPLKSHLLGKMSQLEVHHIFPKARLYEHGYPRAEVNAVANFCFLTKDTNLQIGASDPAHYFATIEEKHPGALASQWIPMDRELWSLDRYPDFLEARRELLAVAANSFLAELLHEEMAEEEEPRLGIASPRRVPAVGGGVESDEEERLLLDCRRWAVGQGLSEGCYQFEVVDEETGSPVAIFDLAWPNGLQEEYSPPVAILINEPREVLDLANEKGFRYFTSVEAFREHVQHDVLAAPESRQLR